MMKLLSDRYSCEKYLQDLSFSPHIKYGIY
jgi:hypothetical protein